MDHGLADPTSLENLHDIVEPARISLWWPLAPGWWVVLTVILCLALIVVWRWFRNYRRNAYRRYGLRELAGVKDAADQTRDYDLVLIDTHGVCAADQGHFARLAAVLRAARPDEVHLVLPASIVPSVQERTARRFGPLGVSNVILTHLDEAVGLGVILNTIEKLEWKLSYVTTGERVPNHIEEACAERMAALVFPAG